MEEERTMNNNVVMEKEGVELNMSLVDKYYYVCNLCLCSGIFTSPEDLHYHNQHQHKNVEELNQELQLQLSESSDSEVDNEKQEDSSVVDKCRQLSKLNQRMAWIHWKINQICPVSWTDFLNSKKKM